LFDAAGDIINYEFDVENTGNVTLTNVAIMDDLIASVSCPQTTLAPAAAMVCTASYTVTQADVDAGEVVNNASASGTPPPGLPVVETPSSATVESDALPGLSFAKRAVTTDFAAVGDIVNYEFDVENTGTITLSGITITDDLVASVNCPQTTLAPAATIVCSASYTVTQADLDAGEVVNNASVDATLPNGDPVPTAEDTAVIDAVPSPALEIIKTALTADYNAVGDVIDFEITVTNTGNVSVSSIVVNDPLIPSLSCPVAALTPTASFTCTGSYIVTQADIDAGQVDNTASVTGTPSGGTLPPASASETVDADTMPALDVVKTAATPSFDSVGDTINYDYVVTNTGNVTLTGTIAVNDDKIASVSCPVPPAGGLVPSASETVDAVQAPSLAMTKTATPQIYATLGDIITYEYVVTNTGNVTHTSPVTVSDDQVSVSCPALPAGGLAPGASLTCSATDMISQDDLDSGSLSNTATASSGGTNSAPVTETVTADQLPALAIDKSADRASFAALGETVTYSYLVTNTGNVTITDAVTVSDDKISNVSCQALPGGSLAVGASLTCTGLYTVTQADLDAGEVTNIASASAGSTTSPTDSVVLPAAQNPALSIAKSALDTSFAAPGDILSYEFVVRNTGNVTLTGAISVSDDKIPAVYCPAVPMSGFAPNEEMTCTGDYLVTQADIDAGEVTNIATASNGSTTSDRDTATVNGDQAPALSIVKSADTGTFNAPGLTINYEFEVTNSGNVTLTDPISVSDSRIASVTCPALPAAGLVPGASITCTGSDVTTQADVDAGVVENVASASPMTAMSRLQIRFQSMIILSRR